MDQKAITTAARVALYKRASIQKQAGPGALRSLKSILKGVTSYAGDPWGKGKFTRAADLQSQQAGLARRAGQQQRSAKQNIRNWNTAINTSDVNPTTVRPGTGMDYLRKQLEAARGSLTKGKSLEGDAAALGQEAEKLTRQGKIHQGVTTGGAAAGAAAGGYGAYKGAEAAK